ncbi:aspartate racemase [Formosa agariphila KMM 3901]|uniref:Aspartate racemase n=1 Tax=Formosa agariphila (strain DSM 15362 / KCTC 12365 / LMG 23005 / KMM 3901 / M-2Alg 35-1) TaxID=1347342 RepID=T2KKW7_FORAG|nr:amino acid racemase [Formosa agariphila]CDF79537.1 aspartate racemase [Formosa agariphila KMM 3901]
MEKIAVIGGLGALSGADLFFKLLKNKTALKNQEHYHFMFEQQPYSQIASALFTEQDIKSRKFYTFNLCQNFEQKAVSKILMPCFASHSFIEELQKETSITIVNIFDAISNYLSLKHEKGTKIGVLTSSFVKESDLLYTYFKDYELVFPENQSQLMDAIYGESGIKNGYLDGLPLEYVYDACMELKAKDCEVILPCITEISLLVNSLRARGVSIIDVNAVYADYALAKDNMPQLKPFKLGIVGGVGPSATVDFMNKIIQSTPATKDQDHIKMIVEQNPQIPDRTANLIQNETDPTLALFSTCKKLEVAGSHAIAIPCNTAHAFVKEIQEHLNVPIVNMITTTAEYILEHFGAGTNVGLLATSGTIQSQVYYNVLTHYGLQVVVPDVIHQDYVMDSIYGALGVKAGYTDGHCKTEILKGVSHLIENKAEVIILGCTELPLMFPQTQTVNQNDLEIALLDPTLILAKKVVELAKASV